MEDNNKNSLGEYSLGFFMTQGLSLKNWDQTGIFSREIAPYDLMSRNFKKIYLFTYGNEEDLNYKNKLGDNIDIIYKRRKTPNIIYSFLIPFKHRKVIKKCSYLKTNQMKGSQAALLGKAFNPRAKLVIRTGYSLADFVFKKKKYLFFSFISIYEFLIYHISDIALVTSGRAKDIITKRYLVKSKKIHLIANYIDTDLFCPIKKDKHEDRILIVGRLNKQKNLLNLIEAVAGTGFQIDHIGGEDSYKSLIEKKAESLGVKINFLGTLSNKDLPGVMNKYSYYILSSYYEGMPKTLLEAMSCGLACIGTNVEGIKEVIKDGENGLLVSTDSASIKKAIIRLKNDKKLQNFLGENARKYVVDNFSIQNQIKKEIRIYEEIA